MPELTTQRDFPLQRLGFCYLCCQPLEPDQVRNRDHIPAQAVFLVEDREPLWLPTHLTCNSGEQLVDEKIGQLIGLKNQQIPTDPANRRLRFLFQGELGAVANLDIDAAVWRWIRGFHAALYQQPLPKSARGALVLPFPRVPITGGPLVAEPLRPQHAAFVKTIKANRDAGNLDQIVSNRGKLRYECVWYQSENKGQWMCIFALDVYRWKDLGVTGQHPARGCAGFYVMPDGSRPSTATVGIEIPDDVPNEDPLDPFGP